MAVECQCAIQAMEGRVITSDVLFLSRESKGVHGCHSVFARVVACWPSALMPGRLYVNAAGGAGRSRSPRMFTRLSVVIGGRFEVSTHIKSVDESRRSWCWLLMVGFALVCRVSIIGIH